MKRLAAELPCERFFAENVCQAFSGVKHACGVPVKNFAARVDARRAIAVRLRKIRGRGPVIRNNPTRNTGAWGTHTFVCLKCTEFHKRILTLAS